MQQRIMCEAKDIIALNQCKEYVLLASPMLKQLLTDKRINSQASRLWQYIYDMSKFNCELSYSISYASLASTFGKTARTIGRWVKSLESAGYLRIQHNFDRDGGQLKNTLMVRLPNDVLQFLQQSKNRTPPKESDDTKKSSDSYKALESMPSIENRETVRNIENKKEICGDNSSYLNLPRDKNVQGREDKSVLHLISGFKDTINNNSVVVLEDADKNESIETRAADDDAIINSIENEIANLKIQISEDSMMLKAINQLQHSDEKRKKTMEVMEKIGSLDRKIHLLERQREKVSLEKETRKKLRKKEEFLSGNPENVRKVRGNRSISDFTFNRLEKALVEMGYTGMDLNILINQITFEARFGSLTKGKDKTPLNIERAINIGIKLVRENRWTTPTDMQDFAMEHFKHV